MNIFQSWFNVCWRVIYDKTKCWSLYFSVLFPKGLAILKSSCEEHISRAIVLDWDKIFSLKYLLSLKDLWVPKCAWSGS